MTEYINTTCESLPIDDSEGFIQCMESFYIRNGLPGISVGILSKPNTIYSFSLGDETKSHKKAMSTTTKLPIFSAAEPLLSTAYGLLVQDGIISFSEDIRKFLPEIVVYLKRGHSLSAIAIEDLLRHKSGVYGQQSKNLCEFYLYNQGSETISLHLDVKPGTVARYSEANYLMLSIAFERITQMTPEAFINTRVSNNTNFTKPYDQTTAKTSHWNFFSNRSNKAYSFSSTGSVKDLSNLLMLFLDISNMSHSPILTQEVRDELWAYDGSQYAMGWEHGLLEDRRLLFKMDCNSKVSSYIGLVPEKKLGFAFLTTGKVNLKKANRHIFEYFY